MKIKHWQDPANLILGIWTLISPWVLGYQARTAAMLDAVIVGIIIAVVAIAALSRLRAWEEWTNVVLGIWLLISPWVVRFSDMAAAKWNAVIVGIVVAALALSELSTDREIGGWGRPAT